MSLVNRIIKWFDTEENSSSLERFFIFSLSLTAFLMPFGGIVISYSIVLNIAFFLSILFRSKQLRFTQTGFVILFTSFYLIHIVGLFYTDNLQAGWKDLQLKLSILLFPLLFSVSASFIRINTEKLLASFIAGCTAAGVSCLVISAFHFYHEPIREYFFYSRLSWFLHPAYYSLYLNFAMAFLSWNRLKNTNRNNINTAAFYSLNFFFAVLIILLSSKIGIITMVLLVLFYIFLNLTNFKKTKNFLILLGVVIILVSTFFILRISSDRFMTMKEFFQTDTIDVTTIESTAARKLVWKSAVILLKEDWLWGVGNGDVNDVLKTQYQKTGLTGVYEEGLNAHNQFLQTWLGLGIPGLLLLLTNTIVMMVYSLGRRNYLLSIFLFLICSNFLTESMLQRQAGVLFFSFFFSVLIFYSKRNEKQLSNAKV